MPENCATYSKLCAWMMKLLIQLLLAAGAESQTDSSSEEEDAESDPQTMQGQSVGNSFQSKPLGMPIAVLPFSRMDVKLFRMFACISGSISLELCHLIELHCLQALLGSVEIGCRACSRRVEACMKIHPLAHRQS